MLGLPILRMDRAGKLLNQDRGTWVGRDTLLILVLDVAHFL